MKKIMITGAAGFIGSHLVDHFLLKKFKVYGVDNFLTGNFDNIKHNTTNENFVFIEHDICKKINLNVKLDFILHFASPASPIDYLKYPLETLKIGSIGTENVLKLALKNNATVLVASTSEVYGDPLQHPQSESYYGNVNPVGPRGVYDEAKRFLEALTMAYNRKKKLNTRIVRIFNTYGPRMRPHDGRAIPSFINQALSNKDFTVFGDGLQTRSFCYISDTVNGISKTLDSNYQNPINIGNPTENTILDVVEIIKTLVDCDGKIIYQKLPENDPKVRRPNIELAKKILNWNPKINLKEGLIQTINYCYKLHNFNK